MSAARPPEGVRSDGVADVTSLGGAWPAPPSGWLVDTAWLSSRLGAPGLHVLDCTTHVLPGSQVVAATRAAYDEFLRGHVPGARFVDMALDFSDPGHATHLMAPTPAGFERALHRLGIGAADTVVCYSTGEPWWATRAWWVFRLYGFERVAVLDGGWRAWQAAGLPAESGPAAPASPAAVPARARLDARRVATREQVLAALHDDRAPRIVSARLRESFIGASGNAYGRPGRIPGRLNLPSVELVDPTTQRYLPRDVLLRKFEALGIGHGDVIAYCGYGIAASATVFALALLGRDHAALYDGSLAEWAADPGLPMACGVPDGPASP